MSPTIFSEVYEPYKLLHHGNGTIALVRLIRIFGIDHPWQLRCQHALVASIRTPASPGAYDAR